MTARSIGDCEIECIKAKTFTCRAFAFRYGAKVSGTIIDNCQLSDWPVRDMDKNRHLIEDQGFDVFERASFGKGCEIQPFIHDHSHGNKCKLDVNLYVIDLLHLIKFQFFKSFYNCNLYSLLSWLWISGETFSNSDQESDFSFI